MDPHDDLLMSDIQTFPQEDPTITAKIQAAEQKALKAQEAAEKKSRAKEKESGQVAKAQAMPVQRKAVGIDKETRAREMKAHKIRLYFAKLGAKISVKEPKTLPKTDEGLDELLAQIETELHSNGGIEQAGAAYINLMLGVESINSQLNPLGLMLSGPSVSFAATVAQNKAKWQDLVTEFAIANAEWFMVGPGKRLAMFTVQMVLAVDGANKAAIGARQNPEASAGLQEEAKDL